MISEKNLELKCPHCGCESITTISVKSGEVSKQLKWTCDECDCNILLTVDLNDKKEIKE